MENCVYFIEADVQWKYCNMPVKIGYTDREVTSRLTNIQDGMPVLLSRGFAIWIQDLTLRETEKAFHDIFCAARLYGEWFNISYDDLMLMFDQSKEVYQHEGSRYYDGSPQKQLVIGDWFKNSQYRANNTFNEHQKKLIADGISKVGSRTYYGDNLDETIRHIVASRTRYSNITIDGGYNGLFD